MSTIDPTNRENLVRIAAFLASPEGPAALQSIAEGFESYLVDGNDGALVQSTVAIGMVAEQFAKILDTLPPIIEEAATIARQRQENTLLSKVDGNLDEALDSLLTEAEEYANAPWKRVEDPWDDEGITRGRE